MVLFSGKPHGLYKFSRCSHQIKSLFEGYVKWSTMVLVIAKWSSFNTDVKGTNVRTTIIHKNINRMYALVTTLIL